MDFDLTDEQKMILATVRQFAEREIYPSARERDRQGAFPTEIMGRLAELGLLGMPILAEDGGLGLDLMTYGLALEEIGRACASVRATVAAHSSLVQLPISRFGSPEQRAAWLPDLAAGRRLGCFAAVEPRVGTDLAAMKTTARQTDFGWIVNGTKMWVTNGRHADRAIVIANLDPAGGEAGSLALVLDSHQPGFRPNDIAPNLGLRSADLTEVILTDVVGDSGAQLGALGQGLAIARFAQDHGRFAVAAGSTGLIRACLEAAIRYGHRRRQFGRRIALFQLVQARIADLTVDYEAARLLYLQAGAALEQGRSSPKQVAVAKLFASEAATRAARNALEIYGSWGISTENPIERYLRDAQAGLSDGGTSDFQKLTIGGQQLHVSALT